MMGQSPHQQDQMINTKPCELVTCVTLATQSKSAPSREHFRSLLLCPA